MLAIYFCNYVDSPIFNICSNSTSICSRSTFQVVGGSDDDEDEVEEDDEEERGSNLKVDFFSFITFWYIVSRYICCFIYICVYVCICVCVVCVYVYI